MTTLIEKTLRTLEFEKVLQAVASHARSEMAANKIKSLRPQTDYEQILKSQDETEDGVTLLTRKNGMPIVPLADIRGHMKRLNIGASLNGEEITEIKRVLQVIYDMTRFFEEVIDDEEIQLHRLQNTSDILIELPELLKEVDQAIDDDGHIQDGASSELQRIRSQIKRFENDIRTTLEKMTQGSNSKHLTDAIVTMRNDRYVIPVKAESRGRFNGVMHDQSASGQTVFIEPQGVVDKNNQLRHLQVEEKEEIERVLAHLSALIFEEYQTINQNYKVLIHLDFIQAKALYSRSVKGNRPKIDQKNHIAFYEARHPLIDPADVVSNDIIIGERYKTIIVTGPNTGGKTIVIKTLGLMQVMGQSGLQLPVEKESTMGIFDAVYADIGDEQSIEQSLSTFSSHMTNIIQILKNMTSNSLILFDELGAGTDPQEGAALAIAILDAIRQVGSYAMITSHYPELKAYGYNKLDTINASMAFDIETLSPTYELQIGVPGRSNAFEIVKRLGMTNDIIDRGRQLMSGESQSVDEMIQELELQRRQAADEYEELHELYLEAAELKGELQQAYNRLNNERDTLVNKAKQEANEYVENAQLEAQKIISDIRAKQMNLGVSANVKEHELIDAQSRLNRLRTSEEKQQLAKNKHIRRAKKVQDFVVGNEVEVPKLGQKGTLIEKVGKKDWMVQLGALRMKVKETEMNLLAQQDKNELDSIGRTVNRTARPRITTELDIRGERVEEALMKLSQYIDAALLNNYEVVNIIHGHGTGALRNAVHDALRQHPQVDSYKLAPANQGGTGATFVTFKH